MTDNSGQPPEPVPPGVRVEVVACPRCGQQCREAVTAPNVANEYAELLVDAQPIELLTPNGQVLILFRPHMPKCPNPMAIYAPDGRAKVVLQ